MPELNTSLWNAMSALTADQALIDVAGNNIANVDNPSFAREQAQILENDPVRFGNVVYGAGVRVAGVESIRDTALNLRISSEQSHGAATAEFLGAMQQVEPQFANGNAGGIDTRLNVFWASWSQLSSDPSNVSLRQKVLSAGQNLASAFQQSSRNISDLRNSLDQSAQDSVGQVKTLLQQLAKLNIAASQLPGGSGSIQDEQDSALGSLSKLIDVSVIRNGSMVEVTTKSGDTLVSAGQAFALQLVSNATADQVMLNGKDVTLQVDGGKIGGTLQARDTALPALQTRLDTLANAVVASVNAAYGANFFTPLGGIPGSAATISVALTDPTVMQTGASGNSGDNSIVNAVAALASQPVVGGSSASEYQAQTVFQLGNEIANAQADSDASKSLIAQMNNQRAAISGVSLDQEAAGIMQYERAYQAAARVITTMDQLLQTAIGLGVHN